MNQFAFMTPSKPTRGATLGHAHGVPIYRYDLWRTWSGVLDRVVNFIMLNPSTADAERDDPTIRRCIGFAKSWGFGGLVVTNLYAYRATAPAQLWGLPKAMAIGPENDAYIERWASQADLVVCAWGNLGAIHRRSTEVRGALADCRTALSCLRINGQGEPAHPLYLPSDLEPVPMEAPA